MKAAALVGLLGGAALVLAGGCSVLVPSSIDQVKCSAAGSIGPPACGPGQICAAGVCTACQSHDACGDGIDNDCNGIVDDGCAVDGGASDPSVGKPCSQSGGCPTGLFCLDPQAELGQPGQPFCTRGCCTSADCGNAQTICWPTRKGSAVCRRAADVGRAVPGKGEPGAACKADTDCRSGLCGSAGFCVDTCCSSADCSTGGTTCALQAAPGGSYRAFLCGKGGGSRGYGETCGSAGDCASNVCMNVSITNVCSQPCCSSNQCGGIGPFHVTCAYISNGANATRVCVPPQNGAGSGGNGAPCGQNSDCRSGKCLDYKGHHICSDACCRDSDCGNPQFGCRDVNSSGTYVLRCVPL